ncbi:MAG: sigma 54-interacting transcriptional regulator [bacterium]
MTATETEYQQQIATLQERQYRFENIISDLSAKFVKIHSHQLDGEIESALSQILEFFQVDRCGLLQVSPERNEVKLAHARHTQGIAGMPGSINYKDRFPWLVGRVLSGETVSLHVKDLPPEATGDRSSAEQLGTRSDLLIPLTTDDSVDYIMAINTVRAERLWPQELISRFRLVGEILVNALVRCRAEEQLRQSYDEIQQLKDRLQLEADYLREEIKVSQLHGDIVGQSDAIQHVLRQVEQVAPANSSVLIQGETGAGKEIIAHAIHNFSARKHRVMVKVNCASLPATLMESELFGREKGAYTGALTKQVGRFEVAEGSTIFLDEIGELSLELQAKLLRVLHNGEFERLGNPKTIKVDVRVIAATNRDLAEEVRQGRFREDLYYRLNVFPIAVPPLRERLADIPELAWAFVDEFGEKMGKKIQKISRQSMEELQRYSWPGNIRELRNVIERALIISSGKTLHIQLPEQTLAPIMPEAETLEEIDYKHITEVLKRTNWRIKGRGGAAQFLGLNPGTLYSRMKKLGIPTHREKAGISSLD